MDIDYVRVYQNTNLSVNDEVKNLFSVYPNPTSNLITISTNKTIDRLELYNTLGQLVLEKNGNTRALQIEALQTGIYSLKIYSENAVVTKRVIKN
ncbi:MAG: T9SS type A sorting domain-containing protein, partial [Winogradskyella sp.]